MSPRRMLALCAIVFAVLATMASAPVEAATCSLVPQLRDTTINQGLGSYPRLARGKETLVRLYMRLPSCADADDSIAMTGGTLTVLNGTTTLGSVSAPVPQPVTVFPSIAPFNNVVQTDSPADPKFVVPGSMLQPASQTASFTVSFRATVTYQSKTSATATAVSGRSASITRSTATRRNQTSAVRLLAPPTDDALQALSC